jgi:hypothetical protein
MRTSTAAAILFLCAIVLGVAHGSAAAAAPAKGGQQADSAPNPYAPCSTTDLMAMLGKGGPLQLAGLSGIPLQKARLEAAKLIQARIAACKTVISQYIGGQSSAPIIARNPPGLPPLPTPAAMTTPPPGCIVNEPGTKKTSYDPMRLYSALSYCVNWIGSNVASPAASTPTPQPIGFHTPFSGSAQPWTKVIYVLALASDPGVAAQMSLQLANNLRAPGMHPELPQGAAPTPQPDIYSDRLVRYTVVAAPAWKLSDYQQQCFNDPSTAGAVVAVQPGAQSNAINAVIFSESYTNLNLQLMLLDCEPTNTAYVNNASYVMWLSHVRAGFGPRKYVNLSALLGALAIYFAFQSTTEKTFMYPPPSHIAPGKPYETMYTLTSPGSTEATTALGVASAFSSVNIGQSPSPDGQTASAIEAALPQLVDDLMWTCNTVRPGYSEFPEPQCAWFSYRPKNPPTP